MAFHFGHCIAWFRTRSAPTNKVMATHGMAHEMCGFVEVPLVPREQSRVPLIWRRFRTRSASRQDLVNVDQI